MPPPIPRRRILPRLRKPKPRAKNSISTRQSLRGLSSRRCARRGSRWPMNESGASCLNNPTSSSPSGTANQPRAEAAPRKLSKRRWRKTLPIIWLHASQPMAPCILLVERIRQPSIACRWKSWTRCFASRFLQVNWRWRRGFQLQPRILRRKAAPIRLWQALSHLPRSSLPRARFAEDRGGSRILSRQRAPNGRR